MPVDEPATPAGSSEKAGSLATRLEATTFNPRWTDHDREVVARELDRVGDRTAYLWRIRSNTYIRATGTDGHAVLFVESGYLWWPGNTSALPDGAVPDGDGWILDLSTRGNSGSRLSPNEETPPPTCPRCQMYELSATGICFGCDG